MSSLFKPRRGVKYVSDTSDLLVDVISIGYTNLAKGYVKAKIGLYHKTYGYFYGTKNVKLVLDSIQHWKVWS